MADTDKVDTEIAGWLDILRVARETANADEAAEASEELRFLIGRDVVLA